MPMLNRAGASIHYEVFGKGYPILTLAPGGLRSRLERWQNNDRFKDPLIWLAQHYQVIALDQRNAGQSRAPVLASDGWDTYMQDHLALLDHLGVERCHLLGSCIGVSFGLRLCEVAPLRFSSAVFLNPIGLVPDNQPSVDKLYTDWLEDLKDRNDIDRSQLPGFRDRMFGGDFVFSVTRDAVRECAVPMLLLPGDDSIHPPAISTEIADLAPDIQVLQPWKGPALLEQTAARVESFLGTHTGD